MGRRPAKEQGLCRPATGLLQLLYRQAWHRWLFLAVAAAFLVWLGVYAGRLRNPLAVKRQWAVLVSRVLAGAAGFFVVRLLLFSYEERVPVIFYNIRSSEGAIGVDRVAQSIHKVEAGGYDAVPLSDVVEFVKERRYVPRKCFAVVIEVEGFEGLDEVARALPHPDVTVLVPAEAIRAEHRQPREVSLPANISLGVSLAGDPDGRNAGTVGDVLGRLAAELVDLAGQKPSCARIDPALGVEAAVLKNTSYVCFLDGRGYNRFGDEAHLLRLLDATAILGCPRADARLSTYVGLFRGKYYLWPVAAALRGFRDRAGGI